MSCNRCHNHESQCSCHSSYEFPNSCETILNPCPVSDVYRTCPEDNRQTFVSYNLVGSIKSDNTQRAMPACGATTSIKFPYVKHLAVDSMVWASGIGYLTVQSFDPATNTAVVKNDCVDCDGQATPGTTIPGCTEFVVTVPPCGLSGGGGIPSIYPYLAAQFTAQANGVCIPITVTTANGLSVGKNVQIAGGTYEVSAITSDTNITICNNGAGVTPGVVVEAVDESDNFITPIVLIDPNPCSNDPVTSGKIIVCSGGTQFPLVGVENNQIPVFNLETGEVNFRTINIPVGECTSLTSCLTLDPLLPPDTAYLVTVASTAIFSVSDIIVISGVIFEVTEIVNATSMRIRPMTAPTAVEIYGPGSAVCQADCCTELNIRVTDLESDVAQLMPLVDAPCSFDLQQRQRFESISVVDADNQVILKGEDFAGSNADLLIANNSGCRTMIVMLAVTWDWSGWLRSTSGPADIATVRFSPNYDAIGEPIGGGGVPVPTAIANKEFSRYLPNDTINYITDWSYTHIVTYNISPGTQLKARAVGVTAVTVAGSDDDTRYVRNNLRVRMSQIGFALE